MYYVEMRHDGLKKYRRIQGSDKYIVEAKAEMLRRSWNELWEKKQAADNKRSEREERLRIFSNKKQIALDKTLEAQGALGEMDNILSQALKINDAIKWEELFPSPEYPVLKPTERKLLRIPQEPQISDFNFSPELPSFFSLLLLFFQLKTVKKLALNFSESYKNRIKKLFDSAHDEWTLKKANIEKENQDMLVQCDKDQRKWEQDKLNYINERESTIAKILEIKERYLQKDTGTIVDYCEIILSHSIYPENFPQQYELSYNPENKLLLVDYFLPSPEHIPRLKEVKYNKALDQFKEYFISEAAFNELYDKILYEITLRTIHELYKADVIDTISLVVFNGYVKSIDAGTGREVTACILSVQASKEDFLKLDLGHVDPKACFKTLKGVGSSKLHGLAPIAPILQMNREDKRFVTPYTVVDSVDSATNIAAMDWQDFENLIRELFEKEFAPEGGEVKITRVSRDEGVDAVIFDPDPIRGGKIIIQAKRYTNVVGVSAVRDLYGTVVNEGAMKGILVTTTDYGPDSYKFAQDKPLTLLNGSNLLHLLEKHGHKAKIDIKEAKKILGEKVE